MASFADVQKARVPSDGHRAAAHDLETRVLLGVVRRGHLEPAVEPQMADREIEHLGADEPDVDHVGPGGSSALDRRLRHGRRRAAHVAPDGDAFRLELLDVGAADLARAVLVDLVRIDPPDVVGFEDLWIQHRGDGKRGPDRSYT